ncbi:unnamed protein product [Mucor hiemalis]
MHFNSKNNMIHTFLQSCSNNNTIKNYNIQPEHHYQPTKKVSNITLDSSYKSASTHHSSIKGLAKGFITSIADSGISISRSGSIIHSDHHLIGYSSKSNSSHHKKHLVSLLSEDEDEELDRMVAQHYILRTAFDDVDFSAPVNLLLSQPDTVVLDFGCGSGTWTMELATQFPKAQFIGIDKTSQFPKHIKPRNCQFEQFEITDSLGQDQKLPFEDNSVDFIFQRDMNWGLTESAWLPLVKEYFRILKPGGWIELVEPDIETHSSSNNYEDILIGKLVSALYQRHGDPFVSKRLSSFMATAGFRRIQSDFKSIPLGWGYQKLFHAKKQRTTFRCSEFARAAANHRLELYRSLQTWFSHEYNVCKSKYETFLDELPDEWHQSRAYTNWHRSTAQKPYY